MTAEVRSRRLVIFRMNQKLGDALKTIHCENECRRTDDRPSSSIKDKYKYLVPQLKEK